MRTWEPHDYQQTGIKFLLQHACAGLLLDPGLGKTSMMLATFKILKERELVRKMLVIAPLRPCYSVWPGELAKWTNFCNLKLAILHGPEKDKALASDADIYVINPEGLSWLTEQMEGKDWLWDVLAVDESTKFKHSNTLRFKLLKPMLGRFRRRYILTGSPAPNGLMDLFGQIFVLDMGNALGRYITWYRQAYFVPGPGGFGWVPQRDAAERIYKQVAPLVLRMSAADHLDLPELVFNTIEVTLPPAAKKFYDEMESYLVASFKDNSVTAANAAAATGKCRQIANGGVYYGEGKTAQVHKAKLEALVDLIEELQGRPALVAYEYEHDLIRLREVLGAEVPYIGGGVSAKRFQEIEQAWNRGELPVLLAQPQSVAHGLNLQGVGAAVIWHSLTWNLEDYEQFIRRVWRQGQTERIVVHHLVAKDTIDEVVMKTLQAKDKTQRTLLEALKAHLEV